MVMTDFNEFASKYSEHRKSDPAVLEHLISIGRVGDSSRVLEVGCGTGNYITALRAATGCSCFGIDRSQSMLSIATEKKPDVDFQLADAEELIFPQEYFDFIFSVDAIHHIENPRAYFAEAFRTLDAGGTLCTATESEWMIRDRLPLASHFPEIVDAELARYPSIAALSEHMKQARFEDIAKNSTKTLYCVDDATPFREKVFSSLRAISEDAFQRGMVRLERDLQEGAIRGVSHCVLLSGTKPPARRGKK
jgi:ubiquinone/menaquinone biosynthesis C-methylase UbiE